MHRKRAGNGSRAKFNGRAAKTRKANVTSPLRGGWRL